MNLEEKFKKYLKDKNLRYIAGMTVCEVDTNILAYNLALIAHEGQEVIAEGLFNYDNKDVPFWVNDVQVSMKRYKGKKVKLILEVEK